MTKKAAKVRRGNVSGSLSKQFMLNAVNMIAEKIVASEEQRKSAMGVCFTVVKGRQRNIP